MLRLIFTLQNQLYVLRRHGHTVLDMKAQF